MKRWAIVTVSLYAAILLLLTMPVLLVGWLKWDGAQHSWRWEVSPSEVLGIVSTWQYWVWLAVILTAQALLLLVPVDVSNRRLTSRRRLLVPVVTAAFLLGNLFLAGLLAVLAAVMGDNVSKLIEVPAGLTSDAIATVPGLGATLGRIGLAPGNDLFILLHLGGLVLLLWLAWGWLFYHFAKADEGETLVRRGTRWLLRGSILELLVAVPSHIILRQRDDCCASMVSFWGIVTGISVMLLSFGPGVFFLFAARLRRRPNRPPSTIPG
jgi:hypothetical protein